MFTDACGVYRYWNCSCWSFPVLTIEENQAEAEDCLSRSRALCVYGVYLLGEFPFMPPKKRLISIRVSTTCGACHTMAYQGIRPVAYKGFSLVKVIHWHYFLLV
jgi:hypothetical protein